MRHAAPDHGHLAASRGGMMALVASHTRGPLARHTHGGESTSGTCSPMSACWSRWSRSVVAAGSGPATPAAAEPSGGRGRASDGNEAGPLAVLERRGRSRVEEILRVAWLGA